MTFSGDSRYSAVGLWRMACRPRRICAGQQVARHPRATAYLGHKNSQHTVRYTELAPVDSRISGGNDGVTLRLLSVLNCLGGYGGIRT